MPEQGDTRQVVPGGPLDIRPVDRTFAPTHHRVYRSPLGLGPVPLLGILGAAALVAELVLLLAGSVIAGLVLMALTLASTALFRVATRSEPNSHAARLTLLFEDRSRGRARLVAATGRAWSRAAPELVRIRARQQRLNRELESRLGPLGEAVHRGDEQRVQALKAQADELERAIRRAEREASAVRESTERDLERERATSRATEALPARALHNSPNGSR